MILLQATLAGPCRFLLQSSARAFKVRRGRKRQRRRRRMTEPLVRGNGIPEPAEPAGLRVTADKPVLSVPYATKTNDRSSRTERQRSAMGFTQMIASGINGIPHAMGNFATSGFQTLRDASFARICIAPPIRGLSICIFTFDILFYVIQRKTIEHQNLSTMTHHTPRSTSFTRRARP